ncbi:MAG: hypothetical protein HC933_18735 [Pleurocapsa sp. SU_196_0]|nr:hypothetical protein [Pleurocapsa sp. SU_196_0]
MFETTTAESSLTVPLENAPSTGTYTVVINPNGASTLSANALLTTNATQAVTTTTDATLNATSGQSVALTFAAAANQVLGFALTNISSSLTAGASQRFQLSLRDAAGALVDGGECASVAGALARCSALFSKLTLAGNYSLLVTPQFQSAVSATVSLSVAVTRNLTPNTVGTSLSTTRPGQPIEGTFTPLANKTHWIGVRTFSAANATSPTANLRGSSGIPVGVFTQAGSIGRFVTGAAPSALRYIIAPPNGASSMTLSPEVYTPLEVTLSAGATQPISSNFKDQSLDLRVPLTQGQGFNLATTLSGSDPGTTTINTRPGGIADTECTYEFLTPGGGLLQFVPNNVSQRFVPPCTNDSQSFSSRAAPETGTYQLRIRPPVQNTISGSATLSLDKLEALSSGVPKAITTALPGQRVAMQFTANAGEDRSLRLDPLTVTGATNPVMRLFVYTPSQLLKADTLLSNVASFLERLPETGTVLWRFFSHRRRRPSVSPRTWQTQ